MHLRAHASDTPVRRVPTAAVAVLGALLIAGCGGEVEPDEAAADAPADEPADAGSDDADVGDEGSEDSDPDADGSGDEDNPLLEYQDDIEIPPEITDVIALPESLEPSGMMRDLEDESAGTLQSSVSGDVTGDPSALVDEVERAVADSGFDVVETEELTADGNPRTRHQWRAESGDQRLEVDLVTEEGSQEASYKAVVIRPMP